MILFAITKSFGRLKKTFFSFGIILIIAIFLEVVVISMLVRKSASSAVDLLLNQIENLFTENKANEQKHLNELRDVYIAQTKLISYLISQNPGLINNTEELKDIVDSQNIDELNILDSTGKIFAGTEPKNYGTTFDSNDLQAFFKPLLKDKNLVMCHDITSTSNEDKLIIYAAGWTLDGTKIIQIGITPKHFNDYLENVNVSHVINNIPVTRGFDIYVVDLRNLKVSASTNSRIEDPNLASSFRAKMTEKLKSAGKGLVRHKGDFYFIDFRRVGMHVVAVSYCMSSSNGRFIVPVVTLSIYLIIAGLYILTLISNLYIANDELATARKNAETANNAKTKFLNNMSHDIRTPMNAILGFSRLIDNKKDDQKIVSEYVEKIQTAGNYLLSLINNVLEMATIESGKIDLKLGSVDIQEEQESVLNILEDEFNKKNLKLYNKFKIDHRYVIADKLKLLQIVINLLSNAIKYTPENGSIFFEEKEIPCDKPGYGTYVFSVTDNGIGISKDFQEHIFESFTREHTSTESRVSGTGLGMSIVKKLVDVMGGNIEIQSEQGKGSKFTVTLTFELNKTENIEDNNNRIIKNEFSGHKLLLVEDNDLNAEIATEILTNLGLKIDRAVNGIDCLNKLESQESVGYEMILMDIQMPEMDGYEATKQIRNQENKTIADLPIIAMTANAFAEDKQKALEAGMNSHLVKPIEIPALISCLRQVFSKEV